ncbi:MAG: hypothetical protein GY796_30305 [Chloroflexi bacterium]|nr:hypothetical protein [Chloroflexota bacterium]
MRNSNDALQEAKNHLWVRPIVINLIISLILLSGIASISKGDTPERLGTQATPTVTISNPGEFYSEADPVTHESTNELAQQADDEITPQASVSRHDTWVIESYDVFGMMQTLKTISWNGPLPTPHRLRLSALDPSFLTDITFTWTGSGNCVQEPDNDIYCTGIINSHTVSYRHAFFPTIAGNIVTLQRSPGGFQVDYMFDLFYPTYLNYVNATKTPVLNTTEHLQWTQANVNTFYLDVTFHDSRIKQVFLPAIMK